MTTLTPPTTDTFPVGHAHQSRYATGKPIHVLVEDGSWLAMLCTGGRGDRQYDGNIWAVSCSRCLRLMPPGPRSPRK